MLQNAQHRAENSQLTKHHVKKSRNYDFKLQHEIGKEGEKMVRQWLELLGYKVTDVSDIEEYQSSGIDCLLLKDGRSSTVEIKTDRRAKETGNIFFETVSNSSKNVKGWGWSSRANLWIIYIPDQEILVLEPEELRYLVFAEKEGFREVKVPNKNYFTIGRIVPLQSIRTIAKHYYQFPATLL